MKSAEQSDDPSYGNRKAEEKGKKKERNAYLNDICIVE
jgi:hypothetical protein